RTWDVNEGGKFHWPHFTIQGHPQPIALWAPPSTLAIDSGSHAFSELDDLDRMNAMESLATTLSYDSAVRIGHIHCYLCQPLQDEEVLIKNLERASRDALTFVCLDLNQLPSGKITKDVLIAQLSSW
ncbi:hypothetical protein GYMLUDRAFT_113325, partial [Collybiopsis luxurians FD-317 M1]